MTNTQIRYERILLNARDAGHAELVNIDDVKKKKLKTRWASPFGSRPPIDNSTNA